MTLVSFSFVGFFFIVLAVYYLMPGRFQWIVLLLASLAFYFLSAQPFTFLYVLLSVVTVYFAARRIDGLSARRRMQPDDRQLDAKLGRQIKTIYILALIIMIGMLAALKYSNFVLGNVCLIAKLFAPQTEIITVHFAASLGISFYTLQMVGYLTDVYWGMAECEKNIARMALFNLYFPQMISGPINRYKSLSGELFGEHSFEYGRVRSGIWRIAIGFFKKLVISEQLIGAVDAVYADTQVYGGIFVWIGTILYVIQIYADFAGCMDIVLGVSECFGVELTENFRIPFTSRSIQEFWQRWHITLGAWLKDYIMYPLLRSAAWGRLTKNIKKAMGKKAARQLPTFLAMLVLWLAMGLWHGGGWNFIGEGIWFWLVIVLGQTLKPRGDSLLKKLRVREESRWWYCFQCARTTFIYAVGALFFKAGSLAGALRMLGSALNPSRVMESASRILAVINALDDSMGTVKLGWAALGVLFGFLIMIIFGRMEKRNRPVREWLAEKPVVLRGVLTVLFIFGIIIFGAYGPGYSSSEFIYGGF